MMKLATANDIIGGLSAPSKMPCYGFSLPPQKCKVGSKLRKIANSVCSKCYAFRGNYRFENVQQSLAKRLAGLKHPLWVDAMAFLINVQESSGFFRWHDAGDLQSVEHLAKIVKVCELTPEIKHWLPTREYGIVSNYIQNGGKIPANLTLRLSAYMMEGKPPTSLARQLGVQTSGVVKEGFDCPASKQGNKCLRCRECWDSKRENVNYKRH